ncbi:MAG: gamma-glutamyl-gamma-aminobutyrate hydrolase family protein [Fimbriimonadaceae bacterium]|nr:gamma-glutamyl-gamma-aminobutyrate hydrolase family protein [Fimbriimonadaceae bacterium]
MTTAKNERSGDPFGKFVLNREYVEQVVAAGGVPVLIPPGSDPIALAEILDGWLIPGGNDLDPSLWGESLHPEAELEFAKRTETELGLWRAVSPDLPVFGICYGCQFINVARGGSLEQHLPDLVGEDRHRGDPMQTYAIKTGSKLREIIGADTASGRSWHHQAVKSLGEDLVVTATHEDGTIEALEDPGDRWIVGVQWHPERSETEDTPKLFASFIAAAAAYREAKTACGTW